MTAPLTSPSPALESPHVLSPEEVASRLGTDLRAGLTSAEAAARRATYGPNRIREGKRRPWWRRILAQFENFLILILIAGAILAAATGELGDCLAILAVLLINAVLGYVQESRAERAMEALKRLAAPRAAVLRDGQLQGIASEDLVPGDLCVLEAGAMVPADMRLVEAVRMRVEEAALTGESVPVEKSTAAVAAADTPLGDRADMGWMGTLVTYGRGAGIVTGTGMATEVGKIAALLAASGPGATPLQRRLDVFGKRLGLLALGICAFIFVFGMVRGQGWRDMLLATVSLAVAAVPEALPAVVTIALALGARRMAKQNALVRRLPAVEGLGSITVICSDKTGTLTRNRMTAEELVTPELTVAVTGTGYATDGALRGRDASGRETDAAADPVVRRLLRAAALCNDADVRPGGDGKGEPEILGDPTEAALLVVAAKGGARRRELEGDHPRVAEIPFDGARKRMTTVHPSGGGFLAVTKGAPEVVLERAVRFVTRDGEAPLEADRRARFERTAVEMAQRGLRVLALADRTFRERPDSEKADDVESSLTFLGLVGIMDPPREDVAGAVAQCRAAGIRPVVITGDHPVTAVAIARRLDVHRDGDDVVAGPDLEKMDDAELRRRAPKVSIYARVSPEHKLRIVKALQDDGELVAMTGDGVNDAPALGQSDIGVAMGITGTDVAREASEMVLLDDRYATIVAAIREGRRIYDNIRRFVRYVLATNSMEIWVMLIAPLIHPDLGLPLVPIQILWINLVTDGPPAVALALEPEEPDVMTRPPRPPRESLFARGVGFHIFWVGLFITAACLTAIEVGWEGDPAHGPWRTMIFVVVTFSQMAHVMAIRSETQLIWHRGFLSNVWLLGAVALTVGLTLLVVYVPPLQGVFKTEALSLRNLAICIGLSSLIFFAVEIEKILLNRARKRRESSATAA